MNKKPKVFLDACCWIAAAISPDGGSAKILKLAKAGYIQIVVTKEILIEAHRNIKEDKKNGKKALTRFYCELQTTKIITVDEPTNEEKDCWRSLVAEKDCHVLAGAYKANADFLVSLDKKHILTEKVKKEFPIPVMDTKEFLTEILSNF
ncbi:putative toxin-antitoxin system toxin component, PIN family [Carboxydothermus hydrogenoformans]|nr:putative toxin-antitoxin system toxin component, PIN family [Carboxydothermus hydrogenoformans]